MAIGILFISSFSQTNAMYRPFGLMLGKATLPGIFLTGATAMGIGILTSYPYEKPQLEKPSYDITRINPKLLTADLLNELIPRLSHDECMQLIYNSQENLTPMVKSKIIKLIYQWERYDLLLSLLEEDTFLSREEKAGSSLSEEREVFALYAMQHELLYHIIDAVCLQKHAGNPQHLALLYKIAQTLVLSYSFDKGYKGEYGLTPEVYALKSYHELEGSGTPEQRNAALYFVQLLK